MDSQHHEHPILNIIFLSVASITGAVGSLEEIPFVNLEYYDLVLALVLKAVSILSFLIVIALNIGKIVERVGAWFKMKK